MINLSPSQLRAARGLLDWSRADLAKKTGISEQTIHRFENNVHAPSQNTRQKLYDAFRRAGVVFTEDEGVKFKTNKIEIYEGQGRFEEFYDFMYDHLMRNGGDVCLSIYDETALAQNRKDPEIHRERMRGLVKRGDVTFRTLATKSEFVTNGYMKLRWLPNQNPVATGFYAFGECLALMSFVNPHSPYVIVIKSAQMTQAYRAGFNIAWERAKPPPKGR